MTSLPDWNEVLTARVHLGYLTYDQYQGTVSIPNKELRKEFISTLSDSSHEETSRIIRIADQLLEKTWSGQEEKVAETITMTHRLTGDTRHYNIEARLRFKHPACRIEKA